MKRGAIRWQARIDDETGRVTYHEWVLRSVQTRKRSMGITWYQPRKTYYWIEKVAGETWVKRSKKHFDYGWSKNIPHYYRFEHTDSFPPPYSASKPGALAKLAQYQRKMQKLWGDEPDEDFPDDLTYTQKLKKIATARKRLNK